MLELVQLERETFCSILGTEQSAQILSPLLFRATTSINLSVPLSRQKLFAIETSLRYFETLYSNSD